ncbi:hypothetical protein JTB14_027954 [Gonioctena quinquepunctata]|nr:hypothetical protein JTB14_027954 [Gonioctena quinquepunctata]
MHPLGAMVLHLGIGAPILVCPDPVLHWGWLPSLGQGCSGYRGPPLGGENWKLTIISDDTQNEAIRKQHSETTKQLKFGLQDKQFQSQNSPLEDITNGNVIGRSMYNFFAAHIFFMLLTSLMRDYITQQEYRLLRLISQIVKKLDACFYLWLCYNMITFLSYFSLKFWAITRYRLKTTSMKIWDKSGMLILLSFYVLFFSLTYHIIAVLEMGPVMNLIITVESMRFLLKIHAFVRSNVPKVIEGKSHDKIIGIPDFSKFLYFLYAPTLIYRDEYPRSERIRWSFVMNRMLEAICLMLFICCVFVDGIIPFVKGFCTRKYRYSEIVLLCLQLGIYSAWIGLAVGIVALHSIQNLVGELLRFGDRSFYGDWWTCCNYGQFFRKWNILVSDWLVIYVYRDFYESLTPGRPILAKLAVFTLSILAHEWMIFNLVGFFLPVCTVFFSLGILMIFLPLPKKSNVLNVIYFINNFLGFGFMLTLVCLEYYARVNLHIPKSSGLTPVMFANCIV